MDTRADLLITPSPRRRTLRWAAMIGGLLIVAAGGLLLFKPGTGAAEANGDVPAGEEAQKPADADPKHPKKGREEAKEKAAIPVAVAAVGQGDVSAYISATANLVAENEVKILAEAEGRVSDLRVEEGDTVRQGQVLATLVREDADIALAKAELQERDARLAYERAQGLVSQELVSREAFDKATIEFEIARQGLAEAARKVEKTTLRAPFDGRLSERYVQTGQHVRPGEELFQVTDFDPLIARIYLPERDVLELVEGQAVRVTLNADPGVRFAARIRQISPVVDTETGTVKLTVEARSTPPEVRPGSFVTVDIIRETHPRAVLIPREAVIRELKEAHVFVAEADKAIKRAVKLGLEEGEWIEALSGVSPGERVVVTGQGGLEEGARIKVLGAGA